MKSKMSSKTRMLSVFLTFSRYLPDSYYSSNTIVSHTIFLLQEYDLLIYVKVIPGGTRGKSSMNIQSSDNQVVSPLNIQPIVVVRGLKR